MIKNLTIPFPGRWMYTLLLLSSTTCVIYHLSRFAIYNRQESHTESSSDKISGTKWEDYFQFLPKFSDIDCKMLHESSQISTKNVFPEEIRKAIDDHKKHLTDVLKNLNENETEGNSGTFYEETTAYWKLASLPFVKTICETGFNAGHSTLVWLSAKPDTKVYSFDLGIHEYGPHMEKHLKEKFPGRLKVTWGDSSKTLPVFRRDHPDVRCDLVIIDGGHTTEIATADFDNFKAMVNTNNIVVVDDYPSKIMLDFRIEVGAMWERKKRTGEVLEIFKCTAGPRGGKGFSVGRIIK